MWRSCKTRDGWINEAGIPRLQSWEVQYRSEDDPHIWKYYADYPVNRYQSALYAFESVSKCSDIIETRMLKCGIAEHFGKEEEEEI